MRQRHLLEQTEEMAAGNARSPRPTAHHRLRSTNKLGVIFNKQDSTTRIKEIVF